MLIAFQVAISLVLLVAAVTFVRTLINLRNIDPGFRNEHVVTMSVGLPDGYVQAGKSLAMWSRLLQAVGEIPGIQSAALSNYTPLSGRDRAMLVRVPGFQPASLEDSRTHLNHVSEGYFESMGIPLIRGRLLTAGDAEGSIRVALINQAAARKFFADRDPLGQTVDFTRKEAPDSFYRIVGVVQDTKHRNLREATPPFVYIPIRQPLNTEHRVTLVATSAGPSAETALVQPIRGRIRALDPELLVSEVITMRRQLDHTLLTERLLSGVATAFGALALVLASVGLYGVLSYRIGQQRRSIGIRMALGASPSSVALTVVRQSGLVVGIGLVCGLPFALLAARAADSMIFGMKSSDPMIYLASVAVLCLSGFVCTCLPARRASSIDPAEALRSE
jgi:predicted permease